MMMRDDDNNNSAEDAPSGGSFAFAFVGASTRSYLLFLAKCDQFVETRESSAEWGLLGTAGVFDSLERLRQMRAWLREVEV